MKVIILGANGQLGISFLKNIPNNIEIYSFDKTKLDITNFQLVDKIILCTTKDKEDDRLVRIAKKNNIQSFRGDNKNVLKRMLDAIKNKNCDSVLRITGDDILVDPTNADLAITHHLRTNAEYTEHKKMPGGTEVEIFDVDLLKRIHSSLIIY